MQVTIEDFRKVIREKIVPSDDVKSWTFGGCVLRFTYRFSFRDRDGTRLQRDPDGRFADQDLARVLQDATEQRAGAFRARGCPPVMRVVEILAIEQGRRWGACTVRDYLLVTMQLA